MAETFPVLYRKPSKGDLVEWEIRVDGARIVTRWGRVGGAMQETVDVIAEGKNAGRSNATTAEKQAQAEALATWTSKKKKGYVEDQSGAEAGEVDGDFVKGGFSPMLAETYGKQGKKKHIVFPAKAQRKYDGHRCACIISGGRAELWSRGRNRILSVPLVEQAATRAWGHLPDGTEFDGELYSHEFRDNFEELSGLLRRNEPCPETEVFEYHVYDAPSVAGGFGMRHTELSRRFSGVAEPKLILAETLDVANEAEALACYERWLEEGFEGAIVRNLEGAYRYAKSQNDRSPDVAKLKRFEDHEYLIIGVVEGRGRMAGRAVFTCRRDLEDGRIVEFEVKMKGKGVTERLRHYFEHPEECVGRLLTVTHQGYYRSGRPRIPVGAEDGIRLRVDL